MSLFYCQKGLFLFQLGHITGGKELYWMFSASRNFSLYTQQRLAFNLYILTIVHTVAIFTQNHNVTICLGNIIQRSVFFTSGSVLGLFLGKNWVSFRSVI